MPMTLGVMHAYISDGMSISVEPLLDWFPKFMEMFVKDVRDPSKPSLLYVAFQKMQGTMESDRCLHAEGEQA